MGQKRLIKTVLFIYQFVFIQNLQDSLFSLLI